MTLENKSYLMAIDLNFVFNFGILVIQINHKYL